MDFFDSVFNDSSERLVKFDESELNNIGCLELKITLILENLDSIKSTGPDDIGKLLFLRKSLSISIAFIFKTIDSLCFRS